MSFMSNYNPERDRTPDKAKGLIRKRASWNAQYRFTLSKRGDKSSNDTKN